MIITLVELNSGFGNEQNSVILENGYSHALRERPGSGYDTYHTVELPEGFRVAETAYGEHFICDAAGDEWEPFIRAGKGSTPARTASLMLQKVDGFDLERITLKHV